MPTSKPQGVDTSSAHGKLSLEQILNERKSLEKTNTRHNQPFVEKSGERKTQEPVQGMKIGEPVKPVFVPLQVNRASLSVGAKIDKSEKSSSDEVRVSRLIQDSICNLLTLSPRIYFQLTVKTHIILRFSGGRIVK